MHSVSRLIGHLLRSQIVGMACILGVAIPVRAQSPPAEHQRFRAETNLVEVSAVIVDRAGNSVLDLTRNADPSRAERRARVLQAVAESLNGVGSRRKAVFWVTEDMGVSPIAPEQSRRPSGTRFRPCSERMSQSIR